MLFWPLFWHWALIILVIVLVIGLIYAFCDDDFALVVLIDAVFDALGDMFDDRW